MDFYDDNSGDDWAEEDSGDDWAEEDSGADSAEEDSGVYWAEEDSGNAASSRREHYKILKEEDIKQLQQNDISTVCGVLSVSRGVACTLLCQTNWNLNSVYENWLAAGESNSAAMPAEPPSGRQVCKICYRKTKSKNMVSTTCGHPFCAKCWRKYIATAISDGVGCLTLRCPEPGCKAAVGFDMVDAVAAEDEKEKYHRYLCRAYVERNRSRKWCPAPGCDRAIEFNGEAGSDDVACDCSFKFCWGCGEESHRPVVCETVAEWVAKNSSEAENTSWILAYTKPCPKCLRPIQKNQGCNHMVCGSPCTFHFCWMCLGPWKGHASYYVCNKFTTETEKSRDKARKYMERYTHYYERWNSNDRSRKMATADLDRVRRRKRDGAASGLEEMVLLDRVIKAWEQIVECRRVLKWSYAYGYFFSLKKRNAKKMELFECLQGQAEAALERLHHCVEKEIEMEMEMGMDHHLFRFNELQPKLCDLTSLANNYFEIFVTALENNLCEVEVEVESKMSKKKKSKHIRIS